MLKLSPCCYMYNLSVASNCSIISSLHPMSRSLGLSKRFRRSCAFKYNQMAKENHKQRAKVNQENDVYTNGDYQLTETLKKNQGETLKLKSKITEMKNQRGLARTTKLKRRHSLVYREEIKDNKQGLRDMGIPRWLSSNESPALQEVQVRSLGQEDPLDSSMVTHSSILA